MIALPIPIKVDLVRDLTTFGSLLAKLAVLLWAATMFQARTFLYSDAIEFPLTF
jgi:hypothetical protein